MRKKQEELGIKQHKLMGDVPTHWGSTYVMVDRILEQQEAISATLAGERKYWNKMPTDTEFTTLKTFVDVLKPLHVLTDALAGVKQVTASALIPILKHAKDNLSPGSGDNSKDSLSPGSGDSSKDSLSPGSGDSSKDSLSPGSGDSSKDSLSPGSGDNSKDNLSPGSGDSSKDSSSPGSGDSF